MKRVPPSHSPQFHQICGLLHHHHHQQTAMPSAADAAGSSSSDEAASSSMPSNPSRRVHFLAEYKTWMRRLATDLEELRATLNRDPLPGEEELGRLVDKNMECFELYINRRREMAEDDVLTVFCPSWCTKLETCFFWIGGCRPSMGIRLLYVLSGLELESRLEQILDGVKKGDLCEISATQLSSINDLHLRTISEEDKLSKRLALLQEEVADKPLLPLAIRQEGDLSRDARDSIKPYLRSLCRLFEEADGLRMKTMREMMGILTTQQAVEYLAAVKQLHVVYHRWGLDMDRARGEPNMLSDDLAGATP